MTNLNPSLIKYENNNGYIALATINDKGFYNAYFKTLQSANDFINTNSLTNCYSNVATFKTAYRNPNNVEILTEHYIDIDNHLSPFNKEQAIDFLNKVLVPLFDIAIPIPSLVNFTGRGLQIHFNLTGANDIVKWEKTQQALLERVSEICYKQNALLNAYGLEIDDIKDRVRYLRNANTYNTKGGTYCESIYTSNAVYTQEDIINDYNLTFTTGKGKRLKEHSLKELSLNKSQIYKANQKELKAFKQYNKYYTTETLAQGRREDLITLINERNKKGINEGYRSNLISIAVQLERERTNDINELYERTQGYNYYFNEPLKDSEVKAWVKSASTKQCIFSNKHLIEKLAITEQEQEKLSVIISRRVKNRRYYNKNQEQLLARANERYKPVKLVNRVNKGILKLKAKELYKQGLKQEEIALQLGISTRTIRRYLKG